jgi:L-amino acid N-acyltransferase YncA
MQQNQSLLFQSLHAGHWPQVMSIYLEGIATGQATFQQDAPDWPTWDQGHLIHSRVVLIKDNEVMGWAALSPVSSRPVYKGVAEVSVYIGERHRGSGFGCQLLQQLVEQSEQNGIWTLQASIFPENRSSVHIHEKCGFRLLGRRERIGQQNGVWRDTIIMERRSKTVGND